VGFGSLKPGSPKLLKATGLSHHHQVDIRALVGFPAGE
jgi:hypothetical protein